MSSCGPNTTASSPTTTAASNQSLHTRVAQVLDPCASNSSGFARNVCSNQTLTGIDTQIRTSLQAEAANITDAGARLLIENQQRWRDAQRLACGVTGANADATQQQCLEQAFRARAAEAANTVQTIGGYTIQQVQLVDAAAVSANARSADPSLAPGLLSDVRFPRIDGPQTPQIQRANELLAQQLHFRAAQGTVESVRYTIAYAGPALISVRYDLSDDTPAAAQTNTNLKAVNVVMATGAPLAATDVFRANSGWEDFITQRAVRDIARRYREYDNFSPPVRDVHETATKPELWVITERGLTILFPPLSFGGDYAMGSTDVTIPWTDLRRFLNPNAPAPIQPQA